MHDSGERPDACQSCRSLTPGNKACDFYTNTSPGKAVRVREASVF
jgi:hypothetical protein